jgi:nucleoside-diphosphate-sugar epimerase
VNRVLVIGGGGFIGGHLLRRLSASASVFATCRPGGTTPPAIIGVSWLPSDLSASDANRTWPAEVDAVIHLAQSRAWRRFPEGAEDVFAVNVAGVFQAAEYARVAGARRLIYLSSGSVYPASPNLLAEDQAFEIPGSRQFYPSAKLAAEALLAAYRSQFAVVSLRLFVPYGEGQSPDMLFPQLVRRVKSGEPIMLSGADGFRLNPVAIADVVEAIVRCTALERSDTMNVAGPEVLTLRQIGESIGEVLGIAPRFDVRPQGAVADIVGDTTRLLRTLEWAPTWRLADGLRDWLHGARS